MTRNYEENITGIRYEIVEVVTRAIVLVVYTMYSDALHRYIRT